MIGWWHAYEVTFGGHKTEEARTGQIVMYAERDSVGTAIPGWVMIQPFAGPAGGATYSLIGARPEPRDTAGR